MLILKKAHATNHFQTQHTLTHTYTQTNYSSSFKVSGMRISSQPSEFRETRHTAGNKISSDPRQKPWNVELPPANHYTLITNRPTQKENLEYTEWRGAKEREKNQPSNANTFKKGVENRRRLSQRSKYCSWLKCNKINDRLITLRKR